MFSYYMVNKERKLFEDYTRRAFVIRGKRYSNVDAKMDAKKIHVKIKNGHTMYEFKVKMLGVWAKI